MRVALLGVAAALAAIALPAAPVEALDRVLVGRPAPTFHGGFAGGHGDGFRHDRRRHSGFDGAAFVYDREYQGDSAWRANSYNDWWHERPHRSYPAWMSRNQNCERIYWSGGGWRC